MSDVLNLVVLSMINRAFMYVIFILHYPYKDDAIDGRQDTMSMFDNDIIEEEKKIRKKRKKTKIQNYQDPNNKLIIDLTNESIEDTSIWLDMRQSAAYIIVSSLKIDMRSKT